MDPVTEMRVFAKSVELSNFSEAAKLLRLTPSAVSKQISRLEDRLGVRLLNRTTRRIHLTDAGDEYYRRCCRILEDIDEAEAVVTKMNAAPRGRLRLSAPVVLGRDYIVPLLAEMLKQYPDLQIELSLSDQIVDMVQDGIDVAIRIGDLPDSSLIARRLAPIHRLTCGSPDYLERHGRPRTPADLSKHNCLIITGASSVNQWRFDTSDGPVNIQVSGSFECDSSAGLRTAAVAGIGLVRLADFHLAQDISAGRLVPVLTDCHHSVTSWVYVVYPHARHISPKVRTFVDAAVARWTPKPPWVIDG